MLQGLKKIRPYGVVTSFPRNQMQPVSTSLFSILNPPPNPWLRNLSTQLDQLPDGIRVIRIHLRDEDYPLAETASPKGNVELAKIIT